MADREIPSEYNAPRAAHKVYPMRDPVFGQTCVKIPYRGVTISLSSDGEDTIAYDGDTTVVNYGVVLGTSGESIRKVMDLIDEYLAKEPDYQQQAVDYGEMLVDIHDELEYGYVSGLTQLQLKGLVDRIKKTNT